MHEFLLSCDDCPGGRFRHAPSVPRGGSPKVATGRGCLVGNPGPLGAAQETRAGLLESLGRLSGDLTIPKGCLSAPAFGDF